MFLLYIVLDDDGCDGTAGSTIPLLLTTAAVVDLYRINLCDVCWEVVDDITIWCWSDGDVVLLTAWAVIDAARRLSILLVTFHIDIKG